MLIHSKGPSHTSVLSPRFVYWGEETCRVSKAQKLETHAKQHISSVRSTFPYMKNNVSQRKPAIPPEQFLVPQQPGRRIRRPAKREDFVVKNPVDNFTRNNDRCFIVPNCSTEQYPQSFSPGQSLDGISWTTSQCTQAALRHSSRLWHATNFLKIFTVHPIRFVNARFLDVATYKSKSEKRVGLVSLTSVPWQAMDYLVSDWLSVVLWSDDSKPKRPTRW